MSKDSMELLKLLNDIGCARTVTKGDLVNPNAKFAQEIFFTLLTEFGMSETMLEAPKRFSSSIVALEQTDMMEAMVLSVVCRRFFRKIGYYDQIFGLSDLTKPEGPRLRRFLYHMANFWLFCNTKYDSTEEVKESVLVKVQRAKELNGKLKAVAKQVEALRTEIETIKVNNEKVATESEGNNALLRRPATTNAVLFLGLESEVKDIKDDLVTLKTNVDEVKEKVLESQTKENELEKQLEKLEKEKKRLEMLVKCDKTKQDYESDLMKLKEDHKIQEMDIQRIKRDLQEHKAKMDDFKSILDEVQGLNKVADDIKSKRKTADQLELEKQELQEQRAALNEELLQLQSEVKTVETEQALAASAWNKRKDCLEEEIRVYQEEIETERRSKTHEEMVSSDLDSE